jgi:hypothetical protein
VDDLLAGEEALWWRKRVGKLEFCEDTSFIITPKRCGSSECIVLRLVRAMATLVKAREESRELELAGGEATVRRFFESLEVRWSSREQPFTNDFSCSSVPTLEVPCGLSQ